MPDSSPCTTSEAKAGKGQRGGILLAVIVITLLTTMLIMGAAHEVGMRLETRQRMRSGSVALISAQAGLENAARLAMSSSSWATEMATPTWIHDKPIGEANVTVVATDPEDGVIEPNGALGSSSADTVRLTATADLGSLSRVLVGDYVPLPHKALRHVLYAGSDLHMQQVDVEGRLRANGDVLDVGGALLRGDIITLAGDSVTASLDDDDTDIFYVADTLFMPEVDFSWFQAAGEEIAPFMGWIANVAITPTENPYGSPSARGIYWIDAEGGDIYFYRVAIDACIAVLNANDVVIGSWMASSQPYFHRSPDPDRLPALVVDGNLQMNIEGGTISVLVEGTPVTLNCGLRGVFYCTGEFWGPQMYASTPITVNGAILADEVHVLGPGTLIRHDPGLNMNPLAELTRAGLRFVPNSTREM